MPQAFVPLTVALVLVAADAVTAQPPPPPPPGSGSGDEAPPRMGFTNGWYANEQRRDEGVMARMQKEGKAPVEIMRAASYPSDGIELAIRRSKIAGDRWLLRLWASAMDGGRPGMLTWPSGTAERSTAGWAELKLE